MSDDADRYLSLAELVTYSGLSLHTLQRLMRRTVDPLPHFKIGTRVLVRRSMFDVWIARVGATPSTSRRSQSFDEKVREAAASLRGNRRYFDR